MGSIFSFKQSWRKDICQPTVSYCWHVEESKCLSFKKDSLNPSVLPILSFFAYICQNKWEYNFWPFLCRVSFQFLLEGSFLFHLYSSFLAEPRFRKPSNNLKFHFLSFGNKKPETHFGTHCIVTCSSLLVFSSTSVSSFWSSGKIISIRYISSPLWSLMGQLALCGFLTLIGGNIEILGLFV